MTHRPQATCEGCDDLSPRWALTEVVAVGATRSGAMPVPPGDRARDASASSTHQTLAVAGAAEQQPAR